MPFEFVYTTQNLNLRNTLRPEATKLKFHKHKYISVCEKKWQQNKTPCSQVLYSVKFPTLPRSIVKRFTLADNYRIIWRSFCAGMMKRLSWIEQSGARWSRKGGNKWSAMIRFSDVRYKLTSHEFARSLYFTDDQAGLCEAFLFSKLRHLLYIKARHCLLSGCYRSSILFVGVEHLLPESLFGKDNDAGRGGWGFFFSVGLMMIIH